MLDKIIEIRKSLNNKAFNFGMTHRDTLRSLPDLFMLFFQICIDIFSLYMLIIMSKLFIYGYGFNWWVLGMANIFIIVISIMPSRFKEIKNLIDWGKQ